MPVRFPRRWPIRLVVVLLVLGLLAAWRFIPWRGQPLRDGGVPAESLVEGEYELVRVVDGDTILVAREFAAENGHAAPLRQTARVRLLGIDTPETVHPQRPVEPFGPEASEFARAFLSGGRCRLQLDKRRVDRYGRFLAYVFVEERMLNEELVRAGLARVSTLPGDSSTMERRLRKAEDEARAANRGIWSLVPEGIAK
jgi:micrococcal nuclease